MMSETEVTDVPPVIQLQEQEPPLQQQEPIEQPPAVTTEVDLNSNNDTAAQVVMTSENNIVVATTEEIPPTTTVPSTTDANTTITTTSTSPPPTASSPIPNPIPQVTTPFVAPPPSGRISQLMEDVSLGSNPTSPQVIFNETDSPATMTVSSNEPPQNDQNEQKSDIHWTEQNSVAGPNQSQPGYYNRGWNDPNMSSFNPQAPRAATTKRRHRHVGAPIQGNTAPMMAPGQQPNMTMGMGGQQSDFGQHSDSQGPPTMRPPTTSNMPPIATMAVSVPKPTQGYNDPPAPTLEPPTMASSASSQQLVDMTKVMIASKINRANMTRNASADMDSKLQLLYTALESNSLSEATRKQTAICLSALDGEDYVTARQSLVALAHSHGQETVGWIVGVKRVVNELDPEGTNVAAVQPTQTAPMQQSFTQVATPVALPPLIQQPANNYQQTLPPQQYQQPQQFSPQQSQDNSGYMQPHLMSQQATMMQPEPVPLDQTQQYQPQQYQPQQYYNQQHQQQQPGYNNQQQQPGYNNQQQNYQQGNQNQPYGQTTGTTIGMGDYGQQQDPSLRYVPPQSSSAIDKFHSWASSWLAPDSARDTLASIGK